MLIGATPCGDKCENTVLLETQGPCGSVRKCSAGTASDDKSAQVKMSQELFACVRVSCETRKLKLSCVFWALNGNNGVCVVFVRDCFLSETPCVQGFFTCVRRLQGNGRYCGSFQSKKTPKSCSTLFSQKGGRNKPTEPSTFTGNVGRRLATEDEKRRSVPPPLSLSVMTVPSKK